VKRNVALVLALVAASCSSPTATELPRYFTYDVTPADGTAVHPGQAVHVQVRVQEGPRDLHELWMLMGCEFLRPDGQRDNSYLPGVPSAGGLMPPPTTLSVDFVVPVGTPQGNSFIPDGSRLLTVRVNLSGYAGDRLTGVGPGIVATYPVVP